MESFRAENGAITKYQFNKEQIALPLSVSLFISCFLLNFFFLCMGEKKDAS